MKDSFNYIYPIFAQAFLAFIVLGKLFFDRVMEMKSKSLRMKSFATSKDRELLENIQSADNFKNLFEMPLLFFVLGILLMHLNITRSFYYYFMWAYVVLRYAHTFIHCSYNKVMHRFLTYLGSTLILFVLWATFFIDIVFLGYRHI